MASTDIQNTLPRLELPEFAWIIDLVETRFGPVTHDTQFTVRAKNGLLRIRIMLGRKTGPSQRFSFSVGKRDFDYLVFGLEGREEVWVIPKLATTFPEDGQIAIENVDHSEGYKTAVLTAAGQKIKLTPFLYFPTKKMRQERLNAEREAVRLAKEAQRENARSAKEAERLAQKLAHRKAKRNEYLAGSAEKRREIQRQKANERIKNDSDFSKLLAKVIAKLGPLEPINPYDWLRADGTTVHFSLSKPLRGTIDRAFICISPTVKKSNWLAVGVRGYETSWLLPMETVADFLKDKATVADSDDYSTYLGFREDQDYLWVDSISVDKSMPIESSRLYVTALNRLTREEKQSNRKRESLRKAAIRDAHKAEVRKSEARKRITSDPDDAAVFDVLSTKFGPLDVVSSRPYVCQAGNGTTVRFATYTPWFANHTRAIFKMSPDWFDADWIALSVKGQPKGWLIPAPEIKSMLSRYPSKANRNLEIWETFVGPRDGKDQLWIGSHYKDGGYIDVTKFQFLRR